MLNFRDDQMRSLAARADDRFESGLVAYARARFPSAFDGHDDPYILEGIRKIRVTAKGYGIERQDDVATFIDFTVMFGPNFHRAPWAADVLACGAMHGPDKMAVLRHRVDETLSDVEAP